MDVCGDDRTSRRARHKPIQSCEIVGILPAEEMALRRALYASLIQDSQKSKKPDKPSPFNKTEKEQCDIQKDFHPGEILHLSSPELYEQDSSIKSPLLFGQADSHPSSPLSYHSNTSLHLCLSTSSWTTTDSGSSSDSLFSPWSPEPVSKAVKPVKKKHRLKKNQDKKNLVEGELKGTLEYSEDEVIVSKKRNRKGMKGVRGRRKKLKDDGCVDVTKTSTYMAQRKFATNHTPPVRFPIGEIKPVRDLKEPPKTEDFITYLCLRGSANVPEHLRKFESPWTPLKKASKTTRAKNKESKRLSAGVSKKLNFTSFSC